MFCTSKLEPIDPAFQGLGNHQYNLASNIHFNAFALKGRGAELEHDFAINTRIYGQLTDLRCLKIHLRKTISTQVSLRCLKCLRWWKTKSAKPPQCRSPQPEKRPLLFYPNSSATQSSIFLVSLEKFTPTPIIFLPFSQYAW